MITRPLDLASKLRPEPRNFDALFYVNVGALALFFLVFGSRFVLAPGLGVDFELPKLPGAVSNAVTTTSTISVKNSGQIFADGLLSLPQLREWLKTLRKKNASVVFATQSLSDIDGSAIAPAIIESCPTRLFLPNERAIEPQITEIYRRFGLNDRQIEILARATPKRDYYCQSRRGNRLFELGLGEVTLALTAASSKSDQALIERILAEHDRAGFLAGWLQARGIGWAADLIPDLSTGEPS